MKKHLARPFLQQYRNRDYVQHLLDDRHFDALNALDNNQACALAMATTGCIDGLDYIPAGAMESCDRWYDQKLCCREFSTAEVEERNKLADQLIAELLAEQT